MIAESLLPASRAARLTALSREASGQSEEAIRVSLRLLRRAAYPLDRPAARSVAIGDAVPPVDPGTERG